MYTIEPRLSEFQLSELTLAKKKEAVNKIYWSNIAINKFILNTFVKYNLNISSSNLLHYEFLLLSLHVRFNTVRGDTANMVT